MKNLRQHSLPPRVASWKYFLLGREGPRAGSWFPDQPSSLFGHCHPDTVWAFPCQEPHTRLGHPRTGVWTQAQERALIKIRAQRLKSVLHPRISLSWPSTHQGYPWRKEPDQHHTSILPPSPPTSHHFHILIRPAILHLPSLTDTRNYWTCGCRTSTSPIPTPPRLGYDAGSPLCAPCLNICDGSSPMADTFTLPTAWAAVPLVTQKVLPVCQTALPPLVILPPRDHSPFLLMSHTGITGSSCWIAEAGQH